MECDFSNAHPPTHRNAYAHLNRIINRRLHYSSANSASMQAAQHLYSAALMYMRGRSRRAGRVTEWGWEMSERGFHNRGGRGIPDRHWTLAKKREKRSKYITVERTWGPKHCWTYLQYVSPHTVSWQHDLYHRFTITQHLQRAPATVLSHAFPGFTLAHVFCPYKDRKRRREGEWRVMS